MCSVTIWLFDEPYLLAQKAPVIPYSLCSGFGLVLAVSWNQGSIFVLKAQRNWHLVAERHRLILGPMLGIRMPSDLLSCNVLVFSRSGIIRALACLPAEFYISQASDRL